MNNCQEQYGLKWLNQTALLSKMLLKFFHKIVYLNVFFLCISFFLSHNDTKILRKPQEILNVLRVFEKKCAFVLTGEGWILFIPVSKENTTHVYTFQSEKDTKSIQSVENFHTSVDSEWIRELQWCTISLLQFQGIDLWLIHTVSFLRQPTFFLTPFLSFSSDILGLRAPAGAKGLVSYSNTVALVS